jgi:anti-sigma factor RsiW
MNCDQALDLLPADVDGELPDAERGALRRHLEDCSVCRATADGLRQQDAELRRGFAVRRRATAATAERVIAQLSTSSSSGKDARRNKPINEDALRRLRWRLGWLMAAALAGIGFGLHSLLQTVAPTTVARPRHRRSPRSSPD